MAQVITILACLALLALIAAYPRTTMRWLAVLAALALAVWALAGGLLGCSMEYQDCQPVAATGGCADVWTCTDPKGPTMPVRPLRMEVNGKQCGYLDADPKADDRSLWCCP
jgi:hypothetical protein